MRALFGELGPGLAMQLGWMLPSAMKVLSDEGLMA